VNLPEDLAYTAEHEWVRVEGDTATVGVTDYAQSELGDIVFIDLPATGDPVQKDEPAGTIEAVKTVADFFAPLSGEVVDTNGELEDQPERLNADPYGDGWMFKIRLSDPSETENLLDSASYGALIEEQTA